MTAVKMALQPSASVFHVDSNMYCDKHQQVMKRMMYCVITDIAQSPTLGSKNITIFQYRKDVHHRILNPNTRNFKLVVQVPISDRSQISTRYWYLLTKYYIAWADSLPPPPPPTPRSLPRLSSTGDNYWVH